MAWFLVNMLICFFLIAATEVLWRIGHSFSNQALKKTRLAVHLSLGAVVAWGYWHSLARFLLAKHDASLVLIVNALVGIAAGGLLTWACLCLTDLCLSIRSESKRRRCSEKSGGESGDDEACH